MSEATKFIPHYTIKDYRHWKGDWELWRGIAIAMTPSPFGKHQNVLAALLTAFRNAIELAGCPATALSELDWIVAEDTVVRPDLIVIRGDAPDEHLRNAPELVAEVLSPSTRRNDLTFKRELYQNQGVRTYLIVDPDTRTIEQLTLSPAGTYESIGVESAIEVNLGGDCAINVESKKIFPDNQLARDE